MPQDNTETFELDRTQSPEEATMAFRQALESVKLSQRALAAKMRALGDKRSFDTILRAVQRMATGEARVSGEMQVILTQLLRERDRSARLVERTVWTESNAVITAEIDGVALSLSPQCRGRWQIHARLTGSNGYSPTIPHWRNSLAEAKLRAVLCVDEALDQAQAALRLRG